MATTHGLSREALNNHNKATSTSTRKPKTTTSYPVDQLTTRHNRQPKLHGSVKNTTESGASVHSSMGATSRHSYQPGPRTKKGARGLWKAGKFYTMAFNHKKKGGSVALENTYKTLPDDTCRFNTQRTRAVVEQVLKENLDPLEEYDPRMCVQLSSRMADEIKSRVKALGFSRYKVVAHVIIGQNSEQGFNVASRGLWDTSTDNMIPVTYEKNNILVVAIVFGTYYE